MSASVRRCPACRLGECRYCTGCRAVSAGGFGVAAVPRSCWCPHRQAAPTPATSLAATALMELVEVTAASVRVGDVLVLEGREHTVRDMLAVGTGRKNLVFEDGGVHTIGMTSVSAYRAEVAPARRSGP